MQKIGSAHFSCVRPSWAHFASMPISNYKNAKSFVFFYFFFLICQILSKHIKAVWTCVHTDFAVDKSDSVLPSPHRSHLWKYIPILYLLLLCFLLSLFVLWNVVMFIYLFPPMLLCFKLERATVVVFLFHQNLFSISSSHFLLACICRSVWETKTIQQLREKNETEAGEKEISESGSDGEQCERERERERGKLCFAGWQQCGGSVFCHLSFGVLAC